MEVKTRLEEEDWREKWKWEWIWRNGQGTSGTGRELAERASEREEASDSARTLGWDAGRWQTGRNRLAVHGDSAGQLAGPGPG